MAGDAFPSLPELRLEDVTKLEAPSLLIRTDEDVESWKSTKGYQNYLLFLHRLSESVTGCELPERIDEEVACSAGVRSIVDLLEQLDKWIDDIPPLPTPQRFGNLAFRSWGKKLEDVGFSSDLQLQQNHAYEAIFQNADDLLKSLLPSQLHFCIHLIKPYFVISFGSFGRMDYGTGHEAAFGLFLLCLCLVRFVGPSTSEERNLVLIVFYRYLRLCWRLQDVYRLEPAGSHGVWGLDDYSFLGYIFGSAQLRDQIEIPVSAVLRPPLPLKNLYFISISRIHQVKHGPFYEHSSQLYSIATGVPNWAKVHSGLFKMYEAEVLGKRVVVQHIPVGGLVQWDRAKHFTSPIASGAAAQTAGTRAPWASSTSNFPSSTPRTLWTSSPSESRKPPLSNAAPLAPTAAPWSTGGVSADRPGWEPLTARSSTTGRKLAENTRVDQQGTK